jgi:flagellar biogenesis protein FliO
MTQGTSKHNLLVTELETHQQKSTVAYVIFGIGAVLLLVSVVFWILFH